MLFICFLFRLPFSFVLSLVRIYSFLGQAWAEGQRGACNKPPRADCGQENWAKCTPP